MPQIIKYLNDKINDPNLKSFFIGLYKSRSINEKLLCMCLLIELKWELIEEKNLVQWIDQLKKKYGYVDFDKFISGRPHHLSKEYIGDKIQFSRVVNKTTYEPYIGTFKYKKRHVIDKDKIKKYGWSTGNGIVWVTPKKEIDIIWNLCKESLLPGDVICDHLGFPRDKHDQEYYKIDYSTAFLEKTYQPNSSNRLWHFDYNLFLAHPFIDYFGRTYNQNGIKEAREQIHLKTNFIDDNFTVNYIGKSSKKIPINDKIIKMAKKRLGI